MGLFVNIARLAGQICLGESSTELRAQLDRINILLNKHGLPQHNEPEEAEERPSYQMYGYWGLRHLRRVAASVAVEGVLPGPIDADGISEDLTVRNYYRRAETWCVSQPGFRPGSVKFPDSSSIVDRIFAWLLLHSGRQNSEGLPRFLHLMIHSECDGFYLPLDFELPLFDDSKTVWGGCLGSAVRLQLECEEIMKIMRVPPGLDPDSDVIAKLVEHQGEGKDWQAYGVEVYTALQLIRACQDSRRWNAVLEFC